MSPETPPATRLSVVITPSRADVRQFARAASRHLQWLSLVLGLVLSAATVLALYDGDPAPFFAGLLTASLAAMLLSAAVVLPWRVARRLPSVVREPWTFETEDAGIRLRGSTWDIGYTWAAFHKARLTKDRVLLTQQPGGSALALPRAAFSAQEESHLIAMLTERKLLAP